MKFWMSVVDFAVLATMSGWSSPVRINSTAGSKRGMYLRSFESHTVKPGTTAASVRRAIRARPLAVQAGVPKKTTKKPWGGGMFVFMRNPAGFPAFFGGRQAPDENAFFAGGVAGRGGGRGEEGS